VLALVGAEGIGADVARSFRAVAEDVTEVIVPNCAHWVAEENPAFVIESVRQFFQPPQATITISYQQDTTEVLSVQHDRTHHPERGGVPAPG